jgi:hypothetical protein
METNSQTGSFRTIKQAFLLIAMTVVWLLFSHPLFAGSAACSVTMDPLGVSGSGDSTDDPYQVSSLEILEAINSNSDCWSKHYILTADIDASSTDDGNSGFEPIGNSTTKFTGSFDGDGHTISGLYINRSGTQYIGLFGYVNSSTYEIKDLGLTGVDITGGNNTGCLAGQLYMGTVTNCHCTGSVSGGDTVGGLVGGHYHDTISRSYSTAEVAGSGNQVGGLIGHNEASVSRCYSTGNVTGSGSNIGGFIGRIGSTGSLILIADNYSWGNVSGNDYVGGFVGNGSHEGSLEITHSYSTGEVTGSTNVGGYAGDMGINSTTDDSFWDTETSGQSRGVPNPTSSDDWIVGKTTVEMQTKSTYSNANWDVDSVWHVFSEGYPRLQWENATDVSVALGSSLDYVMVGKSLTLTVTIENDADGKQASDIILNSTIPSQITNTQYSTNSGSTWSSWGGSLNLGDFNAGDSREVLLKGTVSADLTGDLSFSFSVNFSGADAVSSNDSAELTVPANLNAPTAPTLVSPADGSTDVSVNPVFSWDPSVDQDGDTVSYRITVCENSDFSGCDAVAVGNSSQSSFLSSGFKTGIGLLLLVMMGLLWTRNRKCFGSLLIIVMVSGMLAIGCAVGGGGGSDDVSGDATSDTDSGTDTGDITYDLPSALSSGTKYYWRVTANDNKTGVTNSETWSFTTE